MDMSQLETQQISIRMPKSLVAAIDRDRQGYQVSRSKAIISALSKEYDSVNLDLNRVLKPSSEDSLVDRTTQEILDDFTISLREIKAGKNGGTLEELIAELEQEEKDGL